MKASLIAYLLIVLSHYCQADEIYRVNTERLNIRRHPSINSSPFGYIPQGTNILVIDKTNPNWYKVRVNNTEGYVSEKYLAKIESTTQVKPDTNPESDKILLIILSVLLAIGLIAVLNIKTNEPKQSIIPDNPNRTTITIKQKSVIGAIVLTIMFGPFGMFYSTIKGGLTMIFLPILNLAIWALLMEGGFKEIGMAVGTASLIFYIVAYYFICLIWAARAASNKNKIIINQYSQN